MTRETAKQGYKKRIKKLGFQNGSEQSTKKLSKLEASRETRKRKKMYIDLLQKKLQNKQEEIQKLKGELEQLKQIKQSKNIRFQPNLKQRAKLFQSISDSIKRQDQVQTKIYLDTLRNKLGVAGQDREQMLYNILKQFTELLMPMHARYLIEVCEEKKQFYELFSENSQYKLHMNFNFLNKDQKKQLSSIRPWLCKYKQGYKNIINQVINLHHIVQEQNIFLQQTIDHLQKAFSPCFVAEFLLKLDQKRNNNQIGVIFPMSYFEDRTKQAKERKRLDKLNQICTFSLNIAQPNYSTNIFDTMQDDFDYLL